MSRHSRLLYVIADGAVARFAERAPQTGDFVTRRTLDGKARLAELREEERDEGPGRSFESATSGRHAVGREDVYRRAKAGFARHAAEAARRALAQGVWDGVFLVAPSRLLPVLRAELEGRANVVGVLAKDLTKTPDHELRGWLESAELAGR
jgi:protein required for attachment to host cells